MSKYSRKFKRALALVLTFVMAVSVITVTPSTNVEAASNKVVKSLAGVPAAKTMNVGETTSFKANVKTTKKVAKNLLQVTVKSSNSSVVAAKVAAKPKNKKKAKKGASVIKLTARKAGKATITVTTKAKNKKNKKVTKKMVVTVAAPATTTEATSAATTTQAPTTEKTTEKPIQDATTEEEKSNVSISLDRSAVKFTVGDEAIKLVATVTPEDTKGTIAWKSDNENVATVNDGVVTPVGIGTANITASIAGASAICKVEVVDKQFTVESIGAINTSNGTVEVTYKEDVTEEDLAGTKIKLTKDDLVIEATFAKIKDKVAVYQIPAKSLSLIMDGTYTVSSDDGFITIPEEVASSSAQVLIEGCAVKGVVYTVEDGVKEGIENAAVRITATAVPTNSEGFYQVDAGKEQTIKDALVQARGYFDETISKVVVKDNETSVYNVEMQEYDISKVYLYGTVKDASATAGVVRDAEVTLYADGEPIATVLSDSQGRFVFMNAFAEVDKEKQTEDFDGAGTVVSNESTVVFPMGDYIGSDKDVKYEIKVSKPLSNANQTNVYKDATTGIIDFGSARSVDTSVSMTPVAPIDEIALSLTWNGTEVPTSINVSLVMPDGESVIAQKTYTSDELNIKNNKISLFKLAENGFFNSVGNVKPTLPTETYYVVIKTTVAAGADNYAYTVVPMSFEEGSHYGVEATIAKAVSRSVNYASNYSEAYKKISLEKQNKESGDSLCVVTDNSGTIDAHKEIAIQTALYQKVNGVDVLLADGGHVNLKYTNTAYGNIIDQDYLELGKDYVIKTVKSNLTAGDADQKTQENTSNWYVTFNGAANIVNVKASNLKKFVDDSRTDKIADPNQKVTINAITIKSDKAEYTAPINKVITLDELVNNGVDTSDCLEFRGVKPGKYTVEFDIQEYKASTGQYDKDIAEDIIDLEDASVVSEGSYVRILNTTVTGTISYKEGTLKNNDGLAVLYELNDSKISGIAAACWLETAEDGNSLTYELTDTINGDIKEGNYKLVIRADGVDTLFKDVSLKNHEIQTCDFTDLAKGEHSKILPKLTTVSGIPIPYYADVTAFDAFYLYEGEIADKASYEIYKYGSYGDNYLGSYELCKDKDGQTGWKTDDISAGAYTVVIGSTEYNKSYTFETDITKSDFTNMIATIPDQTAETGCKLGVSIETKPIKDANVTESTVYLVAVDENGNKFAKLWTRTGAGAEAEDEEPYYVIVPYNHSYTLYVYTNGTLADKFMSIPVQTKESVTKSSKTDKLND